MSSSSSGRRRVAVEGGDDGHQYEDPWLSGSDVDDEDEDEDGYSDGEDRPSFLPISTCSRPPSSGDPPSLDSLEAALRHDVDSCGFDLLRHLPNAEREDDFFEQAIVLVNRCRRFVMDHSDFDREGGDATGGRELGSSLNEYLTNLHAMKSEGDDAAYYKPVLDDDAFLQRLDELLELKKRREREEENEGRGGGVASVHPEMDSRVGTVAAEGSGSETIRRLRERVALLEKQLSRAKTCISSLAGDEDCGPSDGESNDDSERTPARASRNANGKRKPAKEDSDSYYFASYSNSSIHETMLRDEVRTSAYERAIASNSEHLFRGKTVLDVGCGTGVLSLFCARAGARRVIAVDNTDVIEEARKIVELNGYRDVVTCVRGEIETLIKKGGLPLDEGEMVDVIVSEWMGYGLFFETMLPSVMSARDALMTPDTGTMFPNVSRVYVEGASGRERLKYWDNVHSFDMAPMRERMVQELTGEAWVEVVPDENVLTNRVLVKEHDLNTCKDEDLDFGAPFELSLREGRRPFSCDEGAAVEVHQIVISFDIDFAVPGARSVSFSTGCQSPPTHWKQTVLWFDPRYGGCPVLRKGDIMKGIFWMRRNEKNRRAIDVAVHWETARGGLDGRWASTGVGVLKRSLFA